jgi:hypothetical protein
MWYFLCGVWVPLTGYVPILWILGHAHAPTYGMWRGWRSGTKVVWGSTWYSAQTLDRLPGSGRFVFALHLGIARNVRRQYVCGTYGAFFMITYYRAVSDIDYVDFMRRARCKVYQSSTELTNLGTTWLLSEFDWWRTLWHGSELLLGGVWLWRILCCCDLLHNCYGL